MADVYSLGNQKKQGLTSSGARPCFFNVYKEYGWLVSDTTDGDVRAGITPIGVKVGITINIIVLFRSYFVGFTNVVSIVSGCVGSTSCTGPKMGPFT